VKLLCNCELKLDANESSETVIGVCRCSSWWLVSSMTATTGCCYNTHWTRWPTSSTARATPANVPCWLMTQWERVLPAATSSVSTADWPITACHLAASPPVSQLSLHSVNARAE